MFSFALGLGGVESAAVGCTTSAPTANATLDALAAALSEVSGGAVRSVLVLPAVAFPSSAAAVSWDLLVVDAAAPLLPPSANASLEVVALPAGVSASAVQVTADALVGDGVASAATGSFTLQYSGVSKFSPQLATAAAADYVPALTTSAIPFGATAAVLQAALQGVAGIGGVTVSGDLQALDGSVYASYNITFADPSVGWAPLLVDSAGLSSSGVVTANVTPFDAVDVAAAAACFAAPLNGTVRLSLPGGDATSLADAGVLLPLDASVSDVIRGVSELLQLSGGDGGVGVAVSADLTGATSWWLTMPPFAPGAAPSPGDGARLQRRRVRGGGGGARRRRGAAAVGHRRLRRCGRQLCARVWRRRH
jgi:hypothetical protein